MVKQFQYLIILPKDGKTSFERCDMIRRQLYKMSQPVDNPNFDTTHCLNEIRKPGTDEFAIEFELNEDIPVHQNCDLTELKNVLADDATPSEKDQLEQFVLSKKGGQVKFSDIIPQGVQRRSRQYMEQNGWILPPE